MMGLASFFSAPTLISLGAGVLFVAWSQDNCSSHNQSHVRHFKRSRETTFGSSLRRAPIVKQKTKFRVGTTVCSLRVTADSVRG
ncbi:hypothetical protein BD779DRAFT_1517456 [Infundibulicybe gibba]|nr:hypothetical protein BD779DRAFT_1517456 [Infundibulicybe gibba]